MRRWFLLGSALVALMLMVGVPAGLSAGSVQAAPCVYDVNGDWFGFAFGNPPGDTPVVLHIYDQHNRQFRWDAFNGQSLVAQGNGTVTAADAGSFFHIEGHGVPGNMLLLKNVHADGTLFGACPMAEFVTAQFTATYTNGTQSQGPAVLSHGTDGGGT